MRLFLTLCFVFSFTIKCFTQPTAPGQPDYGPGGSNYTYADVDSSFYGNYLKDMFWLFEPSKPLKAKPVTYFL